MSWFRRIFVRENDRTGIHLLRSVFSSALGFSVDFLILIFLVEVARLHYLVSASISFTIGTTLTYLFSVWWIFSRRNVQDKRIEYVVFMIVGVAGVFFNGLLMWIFTERLEVYYMLSKIFSGTTVFFWNFFARKFLLFR